VEAILAESRVKMGDVTAEDAAQRRRQMERLRAESRQRIAEVLTPEQRGRYEALSGGARTRGAGVSTTRVWMPDPAAKQPKAVVIRVGLTDGTFTEVVSGELQEGDEVILGVQSGPSKARSGQAQSKGPRFGF
jgi:HlyD family secretion protein